MFDNASIHQLHPNLGGFLPVLCLSFLDKPVYKLLPHKTGVVWVEVVLAVSDEVGSVTTHSVGGVGERGEGVCMKECEGENIECVCGEFVCVCVCVCEGMWGREYRVCVCVCTHAHNHMWNYALFCCHSHILSHTTTSSEIIYREIRMRQLLNSSSVDSAIKAIVTSFYHSNKFLS